MRSRRRDSQRGYFIWGYQVEGLKFKSCKPDFRSLEDFGSLFVPFFCKFQNPRFDVIRRRISNRAAGFDQFHRGLRIEALRDEDARTHRHAAVTSVGAMSVDLAAVADRFERSLRTLHEFLDRDREEGTIKGAQPQGADGFCVRIKMGREREAHVDDEPHTEFAQLVVVIHGRHTANEEIIGNGREVHTGNRITRSRTFYMVTWN